MTNTRDPALTIRAVTDALINQNLDDALTIINTEYPFSVNTIQTRQYSEAVKTRIFLRDGFTDRYTGKKLVYIGMLRLISFLMPTEFPYHTNWKMDSCHLAYWELAPTLDHIVPIARGGADEPENWVTTSMLSNARKANWTLEEFGWELLPPGDLAEWDGLTTQFVALVEQNASLRDEDFIRRYYAIAKNALSANGG
jgi:5-methylcytosine-specific restriction endonuclease McrA